MCDHEETDEPWQDYCNLCDKYMSLNERHECGYYDDPCLCDDCIICHACGSEGTRLHDFIGMEKCKTCQEPTCLLCHRVDRCPTKEDNKPKLDRQTYVTSCVIAGINESESERYLNGSTKALVPVQLINAYPSMIECVSRLHERDGVDIPLIIADVTAYFDT